jgi:flagellar biosynthetic protein FlhB
VAFGANDKTERATPKRRREARKQGQVARSADVNSAAVLAAALGALAIGGPQLLTRLENIVRTGLVQASDPSRASSEGLSGLVSWGFGAFAVSVAPIVGAVALAGIAASVAQVGFGVRLTALKPSFDRLNPGKGLKRMFAPASAVELAKTLAKMAVVGGAAWTAVHPKIDELGALVGAPPQTLVSTIGHTVLTLGIRVGAALALIAAVDYAVQRRRHEQTLKMTKDELRRELKESDLPPELRGQIRRRQAESARRRMMADVPTADVVVVNPTHYAVALRYDGRVAAPEVVAKGVDLVAAAIRRAAEDAGVPIVHDAPLARTLHAQVELGHQIPEELFAAVAEVLAFVFRTARRRRLPALTQ